MCLEDLGLRAPDDFAVVLGQTAFYEGYLREAAPEAAPELLAALAAKDLVRVDEISSGLNDGVAAGVREIPRIVGPAKDGAVLGAGGEVSRGGRKPAPRWRTCGISWRTWRLTVACEAVILDLGLIGRYNYYTGAVYEAYSPDLGFTIASGGRYDNLLKRFGEPLPATGFAISLERLLSVLPDRRGRSRCSCSWEDTVESTRTADRSAGCGGAGTTPDRRPAGRQGGARYAGSVGADWVCYPAPGGVKLNRNGEDAKLVEVGEVAGMVNG